VLLQQEDFCGTETQQQQVSCSSFLLFCCCSCCAAAGEIGLQSATAAGAPEQQRDILVLVRGQQQLKG